MNAPVKPRNDPLFLRFVNREVTATDLLMTFSRSQDPATADAAMKALEQPPELTEFHAELSEALDDIIRHGIGDEFKAFVNNYMAPTLVEDLSSEGSPYGENTERIARVKDPAGPWVQALLCYNLCLYVKAFGFETLKLCKICGKPFSHKGKWALYCSEECKAQGKNKINAKEPDSAKSNVDKFNPFRAL